MHFEEGRKKRDARVDGGEGSLPWWFVCLFVCVCYMCVWEEFHEEIIHPQGQGGIRVGP